MSKMSNNLKINDNVVKTKSTNAIVNKGAKILALIVKKSLQTPVLPVGWPGAVELEDWGINTPRTVEKTAPKKAKKTSQPFFDLPLSSVMGNL